MRKCSSPPSARSGLRTAAFPIARLRRALNQTQQRNLVRQWMGLPPPIPACSGRAGRSDWPRTMQCGPPEMRWRGSQARPRPACTECTHMPAHRSWGDPGPAYRPSRRRREAGTTSCSSASRYAFEKSGLQVRCDRCAGVGRSFSQHEHGGRAAGGLPGAQCSDDASGDLQGVTVVVESGQTPQGTCRGPCGAGGNRIVVTGQRGRARRCRRMPGQVVWRRL